MVYSRSAEISDDDRYLILTAQEGLTSNLIYYMNLEKLEKSGYRSTKADIIPLLVKEDAKYSVRNYRNPAAAVF